MESSENFEKKVASLRELKDQKRRKEQAMADVEALQNSGPDNDAKDDGAESQESKESEEKKDSQKAENEPKPEQAPHKEKAPEEARAPKQDAPSDRTSADMNGPLEMMMETQGKIELRLSDLVKKIDSLGAKNCETVKSSFEGFLQNLSESLCQTVSQSEKRYTIRQYVIIIAISLALCGMLIGMGYFAGSTKEIWESSKDKEDRYTNMIRGSLSDFIFALRMITPDRTLQKHYVFIINAYVDTKSGSKAADFINELFDNKATNPFDQKEFYKKRITIESANIMPGSLSGYVIWTEEHLDKNGEPKGADHTYRAVLNFAFPPRYSRKEDEMLANPLGLEITNIRIFQES
ncbi:MAG: type IV secretion system protein [Lachnospiraceae bacterium]|nr:type IV secretion system protein [Lachnospiraceae bacterium]